MQEGSQKDVFLASDNACLQIACLLILLAFAAQACSQPRRRHDSKPDPGRSRGQEAIKGSRSRPGGSEGNEALHFQDVGVSQVQGR